MTKLEDIFKTICKEYELPVNQNSAQGPLFFLELETNDKWSRLLYVDKVASADFYDHKEQKYLNYSVLSIYQQGQSSFLRDQTSKIAQRLSGELIQKEVHRQVININLEDFSEVKDFLDTHIENY